MFSMSCRMKCRSCLCLVSFRSASAKGKPIELVDANGLSRLLQTVQTSAKIVMPSPERDHLTPDCPQCDSAMGSARGEPRTKILGLSKFSEMSSHADAVALI